MVKLALILVFTSASLGILVSKVSEMMGLQMQRAYVLGLCLPAMILGVRSWWKVPCFARSGPVIACALIAWAGLIYAEHTESHRGLLIAANLTLVLPIAAVIVEKRCLLFSCKAFVIGSAAALVLTLYFDYRSYGPSLFTSLHRLGFLLSENRGVRLGNPNRLGGQLAIAAVVAFVLYLTYAARQGQRGDPLEKPKRFGLGWTLFLSLGCFLTGSRGAFVAWLGGMGLLLLRGMEHQKPSRIRDLVAVGALGLSAMLFVSVASEVTLWEKLYARFFAEGKIATAGSRTEIWEDAVKAWLSDPAYTLVGTGTGRADEVLRQYSEPGELAYGADSIRDCHSAFMEWFLSYGLLGLGPGICLLGAAVVKGRDLDAAEGTVHRMAILLSVLLFAVTAGIHRQPCWVGVGALVLAMLSGKGEGGRGKGEGGGGKAEGGRFHASALGIAKDDTSPQSSEEPDNP